MRGRRLDLCSCFGEGSRGRPGSEPAHCALASLLALPVARSAAIGAERGTGRPAPTTATRSPTAASRCAPSRPATSWSRPARGYTATAATAAARRALPDAGDRPRPLPLLRARRRTSWRTNAAQRPIAPAAQPSDRLRLDRHRGRRRVPDRQRVRRQGPRRGRRRRADHRRPRARAAPPGLFTVDATAAAPTTRRSRSTSPADAGDADAARRRGPGPRRDPHAPDGLRVPRRPRRTAAARGTASARPSPSTDCLDHQPTGCTAVLETALSGSHRCHDPAVGRPSRAGRHHQQLTHEQSYYKWLERSWRGGLRIFVNLLVENRVLCELYPLTPQSAQQTATRWTPSAARLQRMPRDGALHRRPERRPGQGLVPDRRRAPWRHGR